MLLKSRFNYATRGVSGVVENQRIRPSGNRILPEAAESAQPQASFHRKTRTHLVSTNNMKTSLKVWTAPLIALAFMVAPAGAQQEMHRISGAKVSFEMQQTPEYSVSGPRSKKTSPLDWLEIEVELEVKTLAKSGYINQLDAEFFVGVKDANDPKKPVLMTGKFAFTDIRATEEKAWISAYISPATLAKATGNRRPGKGDIVAVAVSVSGEGLTKPLVESVGISVKREGPLWWEEPRFNRQEGAILPKNKTPFAPLWTDRYPLNKDDR